MLNNKGLVVSSVLYTLLIAFLLFLGVTLAQFSSSTKLISNSTKDLVNSSELSGTQVVLDYTDYGKNCGTDYKWYQRYSTDANGNTNIAGALEQSTTIGRIYSRYGTTYWPRDFVLNSSKPNNGDSLINMLHIDCYNACTPDATNNCNSAKIDECSFTNVYTALINGSNYVNIKVTDKITNDTHNFFIAAKCVN